MLDIFDDTIDVEWTEEVKSWSWIGNRNFKLNMNRLKYALQHATQTS